MNSQNNKNVDKLGIVLTDNVDLEWIKNVQPQFFEGRIKFDVNLKLNKVALGMSVHSYTQKEMGDNKDLFGGWIYFKNGFIEYDSTLNIETNKELGTHGDTLREIVDENLIEQINNVLFAWVIL